MLLKQNLCDMFKIYIGIFIFRIVYVGIIHAKLIDMVKLN